MNDLLRLGVYIAGGMVAAMLSMALLSGLWGINRTLLLWLWPDMNSYNADFRAGLFTLWGLAGACWGVFSWQQRRERQK